MKKIKLESLVALYPHVKELPQQDQTLLAMAKSALKDSYSPYSNFKVGAAVLLSNGKMLGGSNQENASYPLCLCAERVALATAASQYPQEAVHAIAVTAYNASQKVSQPVSPCGACRQVILETELRFHQDIRIILQGEEGPVYVLDKAKDLLPLSFDGSFLIGK